MIGLIVTKIIGLREVGSSSCKSFTFSAYTGSMFVMYTGTLNIMTYLVQRNTLKKRKGLFSAAKNYSCNYLSKKTQLRVSGFMLTQCGNSADELNIHARTEPSEIKCVQNIMKTVGDFFSRRLMH